MNELLYLWEVIERINTYAVDMNLKYLIKITNEAMKTVKRPEAGEVCDLCLHQLEDDHCNNQECPRHRWTWDELLNNPNNYFKHHR